jgi:hypothetical protein
MLVRRRSSPAPAGRSAILRCCGDLTTRNHHECGTAWAHPSIRDTGPDGRRLRVMRYRKRDVRATSAFPLIATVSRARRQVAKVP